MAAGVWYRVGSLGEPFNGLDIGHILGIPQFMVTRTKVLTVVYLCGDQHLASGTDIEAQFGIGLIVLGHNKEHSPLAIAKNPFECLFIDHTGLRRIAWVGMQPNSCELLRLSAEVNLGVEKVCHRLIVKLDADTGYFLLDRNELSDKEQVIRISDCETADFIVRLVPEMQQLCPCGGTESQGNVASLNLPA